MVFKTVQDAWNWAVRTGTGIFTTDSSGNPAGNVVVDGTLSGTPSTQTELALDGTQELLTFDPPIKGCTIQVTSGTAGELTFDDVALFCFDAPNSVVATAWLTETNQAPRIAVKPADGRVNVYFNGATVSDIYMVAKGNAVDLDVTIEGVI